jgi:hypothetical protein
MIARTATGLGIVAFLLAMSGLYSVIAFLVVDPGVTRYNAWVAIERHERGEDVAAPAERMRMMRERRRSRGLRELRLVVPDSRSPSVRRRVAAQVAHLSKANESDALNWIESVSEFDAPGVPRKR